MKLNCVSNALFPVPAALRPAQAHTREGEGEGTAKDNVVTLQAYDAKLSALQATHVLAVRIPFLSSQVLLLPVAPVH